jgi:hypothetical protein
VIARMSVAQAYAWNDGLDPERHRRRDDDDPDGAGRGQPVEIKTAAQLNAALEAARRGELVI